MLTENMQDGFWSRPGIDPLKPGQAPQLEHSVQRVGKVISQLIHMAPDSDTLSSTNENMPLNADSE